MGFGSVCFLWSIDLSEDLGIGRGEVDEADAESSGDLVVGAARFRG